MGTYCPPQVALCGGPTIFINGFLVSSFGATFQRNALKYVVLCFAIGLSLVFGGLFSMGIQEKGFVGLFLDG